MPGMRDCPVDNCGTECVLLDGIIRCPRHGLIQVEFYDDDEDDDDDDDLMGEFEE